MYTPSYIYIHIYIHTYKHPHINTCLHKTLVSIAIVLLNDFLRASRAAVVQSVATRAVSSGVVNSNTSSANCHCDMRHSSLTNGLTVYVENQSVAWTVSCVQYWCEKARKRTRRWTGRRDVTENISKTALNLNNSIDQSINRSINKSIANEHTCIL